MAVNQQREVEFGVYKQNVKRRELMEEEGAGLFSSYTDPSRNQPGPLSLVEECRGLALIGQELHSVATPALLSHKEPAWDFGCPSWFFMA